MIAILGAGLSGLSCSYHIGHEKCVLLEANASPFGHIGSIVREGFTWDQGPHVSFTKDEYVRELFYRSVKGELEEHSVRVVNYFDGHWIDHPAQSHLSQVPEPLRTECYQSFLSTRKKNAGPPPANYEEWLCAAFGPVFAHAFSAPYTRKYWTCDPHHLTTDWIGTRVFNPDIEDVTAGYQGAARRPTHYITKVRYPRRGGYKSFAALLARDANIKTGNPVTGIDFLRRELYLKSGENLRFERLISTLPLVELVRLSLHAPPEEVVSAAQMLTCTALVLVEVTAAHPTQQDGHWFYVYDEDKFSTRINCTERLSLNNAPQGHTGVQVEVYHSRYRPLGIGLDQLGEKVARELEEMGFINRNLVGKPARDIRISTRPVPYANVLFDVPRREALNTILNWAEGFGLQREDDDLAPTTAWKEKALQHLGCLILAGRFAQWKYFWTDDCVLRGRYLGDCLDQGN
jgi:protoporphyrinogen oxidase